MNLSSILSESNTIANAHGESKKRAFELISELASRSINDLDERQIFEFLNQRERLGSTYMGHGIAIPHARVQDSNLSEPIAVLIHLDKPIPYGDNINETVDIIFALLVPSEATQDHLDILAEVAKRLSNSQYRQQIRGAVSDHALYSIATKTP